MTNAVPGEEALAIATADISDNAKVPRSVAVAANSVKCIMKVTRNNLELFLVTGSISSSKAHWTMIRVCKRFQDLI